MKHYKTYNLAAITLLVVFSTIVAVLFFWSEPKPAKAVQATQQTVETQPQTSTEDSGQPEANLAAADTFSEGFDFFENTEESLFTQNSLGEFSPVESSSESLTTSTESSDIDWDNQSAARTIRQPESIATEEGVDLVVISAPAASSTPSSSTTTTTESSNLANAISTSSGDSSSSDTGGSSSSNLGGSGGGGGDSGTSSSDSTDSSSSDTSSTSDSGSTDLSGSDSSSSSSGSSNSNSSGGQTILEQLKQLKPLPKIHYSWALLPNFLANEREIAYEMARITHALSIRGENVTLKAIDTCVSICAEINKTNPEIPCSIAINYSPYYSKFRPDLGLTTAIPSNYNSNVFLDSTYNEEIEYFVLRMALIIDWVRQSNVKYRSDVKISALLLDGERFRRRDNDADWNTAMGKALNDIHVKAVELFPDTRIEWYGRGMRQGYDENYLILTNYIVDNLIMTGMSHDWYTVPERTRMQKLFQATCNLADTHVIDGKTPWKGLDVTPWLGLAYGYDWSLFRTDIDPSIPQPNCYRIDWDYDVKYSRETGAELNSNTPPYDRVKVVIIFPQLFYKWTSPWYNINSVWAKHFIEYCKGAAQATGQ